MTTEQTMSRRAFEAQLLRLKKDYFGDRVMTDDWNQSEEEQTGLIWIFEKIRNACKIIHQEKSEGSTYMDYTIYELPLGLRFMVHACSPDSYYFAAEDKAKFQTLANNF